MFAGRELTDATRMPNGTAAANPRPCNPSYAMCTKLATPSQEFALLSHRLA